MKGRFREQESLTSIQAAIARAQDSTLKIVSSFLGKKVPKVDATHLSNF